MTLRELGEFFLHHFVESMKLALQPSLILDANIFYIPIVILIWALWFWMILMILGSTLEAVGNIFRSPRKGLVALLKYYPVQLFAYLASLTLFAFIGGLIHLILVKIGLINYSEDSDDVLYAMTISCVLGFFIFRYFYIKHDWKKIFFPDLN